MFVIGVVVRPVGAYAEIIIAHVASSTSSIGSINTLWAWPIYYTGSANGKLTRVFVDPESLKSMSIPPFFRAGILSQQPELGDN